MPMRPVIAGPSLFDRGAKALRDRTARPDAKRRARRPAVKLPKSKRKVQGAGT